MARVEGMGLLERLNLARCRRKQEHLVERAQPGLQSWRDRQRTADKAVTVADTGMPGLAEMAVRLRGLELRSTEGMEARPGKP